MYYYQEQREEENPEYEAFINKFKPKKTTDDCYTPPHIYNAVLNWAVQEYGLQGRKIVRPFYPGGDYENYPYTKDCAVVDNPPFSILSKIMDYYGERGIPFFLFAPALTVISSCRGKYNAVITDSDITYENGAKVKTAFVTNMGQYLIHVSSELHDAIKEADKKEKQANVKTLPRYEYPDEVLTAAVIQKIAKRGQTLRIRKEDCAFVRSLKSQKEKRKTIFGGGYLLSERAAAERAAAERAAAERAAAERAAAERAAAERAAAERAAAERAAAERAAAERAAAERAAAERAAAEKWDLSDEEREIIAALGGD